MLRALIFSGVLACVPIQAETLAIHFYVASGGDDSWSGSYPDPIQGTGEGPLRTIEAALEAAAEALDGENTSVSVEVRKGRYIIEQPLSISNANSGVPDNPFILTGYRNEQPVIDLQNSGSSIVRIDSAHDVVISNLILTGKATVGIELTGTDRINLQRLDLSVFDQGVKILDSGVAKLAGNKFKDTTNNQILLDSLVFPSSASGNLLISSQLASVDSADSILILAQNRTEDGETTAIKREATSLRDALIAHYSFGPDNWRSDRIAGQNLVVRGELGIQETGHVGNSVRLGRNSIQHAPITWNGSDLPRTVNFWYWNADSTPRDTYFLTSRNVDSKQGFILQHQNDSIVLEFGASTMTWSAPDLRGKPTMLSLIVPHRSARLSELQMCVNGALVSGSIEGEDSIFDTSDSTPYIASRSDQMNLSGQKHRFDELSFWNRALSIAEVSHLYNEGKGFELFPPPRRARGEIYYPRHWDWPWQIDTSQHRDNLLETWESLKEVDIGSGVPPLVERRFTDAPQKRFHVDPNQGNDLFGSGSPARPFKTLQRAVDAIPINGSQQLTQSTVIDLAPGIYELDQRLSIDSWGSEKNWLAIRGPGNGGPRPIITYSNRAVERVLKDRDAGGKGGMEELIKVQGQYIELSGLILDQRRDELPDGVKIHGAAIRFFAHIGQTASNGVGCRVLDTEIRNFLHAGIKGDAKGLIIDGVFIHDGGNTYHDHCIYISSEGEGSRFEVRRSLLMNATGAGTNQHKTSDGRDLPAPEGAIITHNVIMGCERFGVTTAGMGGHIAHNAFGYSSWFGVHFYRSSASLTHVQNNLFVGYPDPQLSDVAWTSYHLGVAQTKRAAGVVVEGNYFESGPTSDRRSDPVDPDPWEAGKTYYTSNTVERNGAYYICEVIDNTKSASSSGPKGVDPNLPSMDGSNLRWWFLTEVPNRVGVNFLNGENGEGKNFVDILLGDFHLRKNGQAIGIGVDLGYSNGRNPGPWPIPVP